MSVARRGLNSVPHAAAGRGGKLTGWEHAGDTNTPPPAQTQDRITANVPVPPPNVAIWRPETAIMAQNAAKTRKNTHFPPEMVKKRQLAAAKAGPLQGAGEWRMEEATKNNLCSLSPY